MKESRTEFVRRSLNKNRHRLKAISGATEVAYTTVKNICYGTVKDPRGSNLDRLYNFFVGEKA